MINEFGYDDAENIEDFFQKVINWQNEQKPSRICVDTSKKFVKMILEKPKSLSVFEETIIIYFDHSVIEVKNNIGEFFFLGSKS